MKEHVSLPQRISPQNSSKIQPSGKNFTTFLAKLPHERPAFMFFFALILLAGTFPAKAQVTLPEVMM